MTKWVKTGSDEENHKYNGNMSTATWPPLQYAKWPPKGTYSPLRKPHSCPPLLYQLHQLILQPCCTPPSVPNGLIRKYLTEHHTWQWELSTFWSPWVHKQQLFWGCLPKSLAHFSSLLHTKLRNNHIDNYPLVHYMFSFFSPYEMDLSKNKYCNEVLSVVKVAPKSGW